MSLVDQWWTYFHPPTSGYLASNFALGGGAVSLSYPSGADRPTFVIPMVSPTTPIPAVLRMFAPFTVALPADSFGGVAYIWLQGKIGDNYQLGWSVQGRPFITIFDPPGVPPGNQWEFYGSTFSGTLTGSGWTYDLRAGWTYPALGLPLAMAGASCSVWIGVDFIFPGGLTFSGSNTFTIQHTATDVGVRSKTHGAMVVSGGALKKVPSMVVVQGGAVKDVTEAYAVRSGAFTPIIDPPM